METASILSQREAQAALLKQIETYDHAGRGDLQALTDTVFSQCISGFATAWKTHLTDSRIPLTQPYSTKFELEQHIVDSTRTLDVLTPAYQQARDRLRFQDVPSELRQQAERLNATPELLEVLFIRQAIGEICRQRISTRAQVIFDKELSTDYQLDVRLESDPKRCAWHQVTVSLSKQSEQRTESPEPVEEALPEEEASKPATSLCNCCL